MEFAHNIFSNERLRHWSFFSFATRGREEAITADRPAQMRAASRTRPLRILLVEDHKDTLRSLKFLLTRLGHQVLGAENMTEALRIADAEQFDLLLSDIGLPDGSGLELIRQIRQKREINAIAVSGYGMDDDIRRSQEAGFFEHLTKPINLDRLQEVIERIEAQSR
jgi:CheY-like chemotaxis protein